MEIKCCKCDEMKSESSFRICRLYKGMAQGQYRRSECVECEKKIAIQLRQAKASAPASDGRCDCCDKQIIDLTPDHDHVTGKFRGWLCRNCNQGIGKLGDTAEKVERAVAYLQKAALVA